MTRFTLLAPASPLANGLYKTEVGWRQRSWPTAAVAEMATLRSLDRFNNRRLFGPVQFAKAEANDDVAKQDLDRIA